MGDVEMAYEMCPHTADLSLRLWAADLSALLVSAVEGVVSLITDVNVIGQDVSRKIGISYETEADLLVDLMNDILFHFETEQVLLPWLRIDSLEPRRMRGTLAGGTWTPEHFPILRVPKIVTRHGSGIRHTPHGLETIVVIDC